MIPPKLINDNHIALYALYIKLCHGQLYFE